MLKKKPMNIWDVNIDNIAISELVKTKTYLKYLIRYSDKVIGSLVLIMPKISGYVKNLTLKMEIEITATNLYLSV